MRTAAAEALLERCVYEPERLPEAMGAAGRMLGFDYFCLVSSNLEHPAFIVPEQQREGIDRYFNDGWINVDYRARSERPLPLNTLFLDHRTISAAERKRTDIYNDFFVPWRMAYYAGMRFDLGRDEEWFCFVSRAEDSGPIEGDDARAFKRLARSATQTASLATRMHDTHANGMLAALAQSNSGAVLLDRLGRVMHVSPDAEQAFGADFGVRDRMLWSSNPADAPTLASLAMLARGQWDGQDTRKRLLIHGVNRRRPILVTVMHVLGPALDDLPGARLIVLLQDLGRRGGDLSNDLCDLFDLTPTEAQIAMAIFDGLEASVIAARRNVAETTVRKQIASIFGKLNVHRQPELVRLLSRLSR